VPREVANPEFDLDQLCHRPGSVHFETRRSAAVLFDRPVFAEEGNVNRHN
jgi:hypothetical protein